GAGARGGCSSSRGTQRFPRLGLSLRRSLGATGGAREQRWARAAAPPLESAPLTGGLSPESTASSEAGGPLRAGAAGKPAGVPRLNLGGLGARPGAGAGRSGGPMELDEAAGDSSGRKRKGCELAAGGAAAPAARSAREPSPASTPGPVPLARPAGRCFTYVQNIDIQLAMINDHHTVLLRSDGTAAACGDNSSGQCDVPAPGDGLAYTQVAASADHTVLLRSDGTAAACGDNRYGQCDVPAPGDGLAYTQVAAGGFHTVLLRSDGTAAACGGNSSGQCDVPAPGDGLAYTQVAAGDFHTVLLRSDGTAAACGSNRCGQCDVPAPGDGLAYTQVAAGGKHTVLLLSDGTAAACGGNFFGQLDVPAPGDGLAYTQIAAGGDHTVLLRSDGTAAACGKNRFGQCDVPAPGDGLAYTQVAAGAFHTVLLRSDGTAAAYGSNRYGQLDVPAPGDGLAYAAVCSSPPSAPPPLLLQAFLDGSSAQFVTLAGEEFARVPAALSVADVRARLAAGLRSRAPGPVVSHVDAVLTGGGLLSRAPAEETVAAALG
ncbi:unnamed protein product, partial [Prorocentrum cordatum]